MHHFWHSHASLARQPQDPERISDYGFNHSSAELSGTKRTPAAVNAEEGMRVEVFRRETDVKDVLE
jgi:hypothetical protein